MDARSWDPHGLALIDFSNGDTSAKVAVYSADGGKEKMPMSIFFRKPRDFPFLEQSALSLCRGSVLDVGAGAGCHSLVLQEQGLSVCAIDISPEAVEVMKKRGVKEVYCADIFEFQAGPFDTILLMMNGIGVVENLAELDRFLHDIHHLLRPDGQILLDSCDPRGPGRAMDPVLSKAGYQPDRYLGEVQFQLEYKGKKGPPFWWLFVDSDTLTAQALEAGWFCQVIYQEGDGHYLARLLPL